MKPLTFLCLSDVHVGNPRLEPLHLLSCIRKYLLPKITEEVDYIFIAGDFFDLLVNMNSVASVIALTIISEIKAACMKADCQLRVLRGTFTHDRNQPRHFLTVSPEYNLITKLFTEMAIEYDEKNDLSILYMPDNLAYPNIYEEVEKLLVNHSLSQVDLVIHHGYFKHMLPPGIPEPNGTLDAEKFCKIVRGCVLNGHVHIPSVYKNVVSIGSFDRFAHGEEEAKGFTRVHRNEQGAYSFEFIENKDANPFWTVDLRAFSESKDAFDHFNAAWMPKLDKYKTADQQVHIRIVNDRPEIIEGCTQLVRDKFSNVMVDRGLSAKHEQTVENIPMCLDELPTIDPMNLESLLKPLLKEKNLTIDDAALHDVIEFCKKSSKH